MDKYKITIGLEVHVALKTKSKLFSRSPCDFESNTFSLFDAGVPGMMPVLSKEPVHMALKFAHSVNSDIQEVSYFERKHYFYPDLPLGYQITQQHQPIMIGGKVPIFLDGKMIEVQIEHAHLECDAAKSLHDKHREYTAIDLARCSSPLLEIVSTPCMHSPEEAKLYAQTVCELVKYLGICDGRLEEGSFRVDASISLSKNEVLGTRVEIKNISSFSFLQSALEYEIERQSDILDSGSLVDMETRLFNEKTLTTHSMRKKETVHEYKYMKDPDIPALVLTKDYISNVKEELGNLYFNKKRSLDTLFESFSIKLDSAAVLSSIYKDLWSLVIANKEYQEERILKILGFWIPETFSKELPKREISLLELSFLNKSGLQAKECKDILLKWNDSNLSIDSFLPKFISEEELSVVIVETFRELEEQVLKYQAGEEKLLQFIIGKVMSKVKGKSPASTVRDEVIKKLQKN